VATMLCVPAGSVVVVQYAIFVIADPVSMLAEQPAIVAPLAVNSTVPPGGELAFTLAENVTLLPKFDGFWELETYVSVAWANASNESSKASAARTLAALRGEHSFMAPSLAIEAAKRFDIARMVQPSLVLVEGTGLRDRPAVDRAQRSTGGSPSTARSTWQTPQLWATSRPLSKQPSPSKNVARKARRGDSASANAQVSVAETRT
jgi:hypothetical protein